jgi:uncharacterized protein YidB (DUF937 family)
MTVAGFARTNSTRSAVAAARKYTLYDFRLPFRRRSALAGVQFNVSKEDAMGLLDGLLNSMMGGSSSQPQNPLMVCALQLLQQNGGIEGVLAKCQQAGFGTQAQSWIGTGQNMSIDSSALSQIFGQGQLSEIAQRLGMNQNQVAGGLAQTLPNVVDQMTPTGQIPANHNDLVNQALAILQQHRSA